MKEADGHRGVCQAFVNKDRLETRRILESWILEIELYDLIFLKSALICNWFHKILVVGLHRLEQV